MAQFKQRKKSNNPEVSTASLPDIVFILLFFFMTVTVMKDDNLKVENELPSATEITSLDEKDRVITIYIGKPEAPFDKRLGIHPKIQINNKFVAVSDLGLAVLAEIEKKPEALRQLITVALKVDKKANMGLVSDVKEELRKINALKITYATNEGNINQNFQK